MRTLYVYADIDWQEAPVPVGELGYESLRGSDSYSFKFDDEWLRRSGNVSLSADLNNYPGQQYAKPEATSSDASATPCPTAGDGCC